MGSERSPDPSTVSTGRISGEPVLLSLDVTLPGNKPETSLAAKPLRDLTDEIFAVFGNRPAWDTSEGMF
jgi:hypothetical protein